VQQIVRRLHITYVESRSIVPVNAAHRAMMWPSFGGIKVKNPGLAPGFSSLKDPNTGLFLGLFGLSFRLVAGTLLEGSTKNVAKRGP
jgi:hypothetical protein